MESKQLAVSRRFFKIMLPGFHLQLKLPPVICKELENNETQTVILHSRKGEWKISMCRNCNEDEDDDGLICFRQGWPQFVDRHALNLGDFIVFEHTGKLHFNVSVFDSSACEKEFLVVPKKEKEEETSAETASSHPRKRAGDDESPCFEKKMTPYLATKDGRVNIPVEFAKLNKLEKKTSSVILKDSGGRKWPVQLCFHRCTGVLRMYNGWLDFYTSNGLKDGDVCVFKLQTHTNKLQFNVSVIKSSACQKKSRVEPKKGKEETSAATTSHPRKRARDSESPCFEKKMIPYFATKHAKVNIPVEFVRSNNLKLETSSVILKDSGGRKWPVLLCFDRYTGVLRMFNGWHDFYTSNSLKDGDVCVFKLQTHTNKLQFNVSVIKSSACEKKSRVEPKKKEETSAKATSHPRKRARRDDKNLYFEKKMIPYFATKGALVNIPVEFARLNNLEQKTSSVILKDSVGRKWPVHLYFDRSNGVLRMFRGWHDFYTSNSLKDGDVCVFKLQTHTNKLRFNVNVIKSSACEKKFRVEPNKEKEETSTTATGHLTKRPRSGDTIDYVADDGSSCFEKKMTPYYATKKGKLNIPAEFLRSNNLGEKSSVTLRDSGGKKWAVKLLVERRDYGVCLRMSTGWHDFYEAKNLKDGDVCVFKLNPSLQTQTDMFFDVQINPA